MSYQQNQLPKRTLVNNQPRSLKQEQGVAIVMALFIVAIITTLSYVMIARIERDLRRTSLLTHNLQAECYAQGSIAWAMDVLRNNWLNKKPNKLIDKMPLASGTNEVNGYKISSTIYDMQARFNLNSLINQEAQVGFILLLRAVHPKLTEQNAIEITHAVADWIVPNRLENDLTRYYLGLSPPYRPAHRLMQNISELQLVKGMTPELYASLQPYITALPEKSLINVQTADAPVLMSLNPKIDAKAAKSIISFRQENPILTPEAFANLEVIKNREIQDTKIAVSSNYFLVETKVTIDEQELVLYTLLKRSSNEGRAALTILCQSKGMW